ncbi:MAG: hypothetical protein K0Q50_2732 [Vampirovibrio sp.]|nr:hypothetical protein [Vampirovibrio sp.]
MISSFTPIRFGNHSKPNTPKAYAGPSKAESNQFEDAFARQLQISDLDSSLNRPVLKRQISTDSMRELMEIPMVDSIDEESDRKAYPYLTREEREAYRVRINDEGILCNVKGEPLGPSGSKKWEEYIYSMTRHRDMFACLRFNKEGLRHSSFAIPEEEDEEDKKEETGKPKRKLAGAGEWRINSKHMVVMDNSSGHFKPPGKILDQAANILAREGADMTKIKKLYVNA